MSQSTNQNIMRDLTQVICTVSCSQRSVFVQDYFQGQRHTNTPVSSIYSFLNIPSVATKNKLVYAERMTMPQPEPIGNKIKQK